MQLDKTRLVIRERSNSELLDLSFHVLCKHVAPLTILLVIGILPFGLLNFWLVGWIPRTALLDYGPDELAAANLRYYWAMSALIFLQAPLATSLITIYLGQAVFVERPRLRSVFEDLRRLGLRQLWCQGIVRLALPISAMVATLDRTSAEIQGGIEIGLLGIGTVVVAVWRSLRPYVSEIVLLEKNPLRSRNPAAMTVAKRSKMLHGSHGGDLFSRWLGAALATSLLLLAIYHFFLFLQGVFLNNWDYSTWFMIHVAFPLSMWMVAGYVAVYRFLSYLNLRIHNEGWEVDLLLRAEAARLQESPATT